MGNLIKSNGMFNAAGMARNLAYASKNNDDSGVALGMTAMQALGASVEDIEAIREGNFTVEGDDVVVWPVKQ